MEVLEIRKLLLSILEDNKAEAIREIDVRKLTSFADCIIICSAISKRHISALRKKVILALQEIGEKPLGIHGDFKSDWLLIDLSYLVLHIMLPETRNFYGLEELWKMTNLNLDKNLL